MYQILDITFVLLELQNLNLYKLLSLSVDVYENSPKVKNKKFKNDTVKYISSE